MKYWISEYDIDGFRCDMARTVPLDFWIEARAQCDALKPLFWLAECEIPEYHEAFDLTYGWEAMRAVDKYKKNPPELTLADVLPVLHSYSRYPVGSRKLLFTSNHDENTYWGTEYEKYGTAALALAVFSCTWPGVPLLYSGQEKPNLKRLAFFEKDSIDWDGDIELHDFYKTLLKFRKKSTALKESASVLLIPSGNPDVLIYICRRRDDKVFICLNLSSSKSICHFNHPAVAGTYKDLFSEKPVVVARKETYTLQPGEYRVYHITESDPAIDQ